MVETTINCKTPKLNQNISNASPSLFHSQHTRQATCKNWVLFNPPKWHHRIYRARRPLLIQSSVLPIHVILGYLANPPLDIESLELVKSSQHTSTSNTPEDVSSSTFHQRHESLRLDDLDSTVHGSLVLDGLTRGHHHTPTDGVNGVGDQPRSDGDNWKTVKTLEIFPMTWHVLFTHHIQEQRRWRVRGHLQGRLVSMYHRIQSSNLCRLRYQHTKWQILCTDQQSHQIWLSWRRHHTCQ